MWIFITVLIVFLFIYYLCLKGLSKRQKNKLLEKYNEDLNKSRPSSKNAPGRYGKTTDRSNESESVVERDDESETGRVLQTTDVITSGKDKRKFRNISKTKRIEL